MGFMKMRLFATFFALASVVTLAQGLAGFSVQPSGSLETDLGTGINTLATGGTVTDNNLDLTLNAKWIQYRDNDFYKARNANFKSKDGTFVASSLNYETKRDVMTLETMRYNSKDFSDINSDTGKIFGNGIVVLEGKVNSAKPLLRASTIVIDSRAKQAIVFGVFSYQNGKVTLKGQKDTSTLLLTFEDKVVKANTRVPEALFARLKPFAR
jgi:hypothetical protein